MTIGFPDYAGVNTIKAPINVGNGGPFTCPAGGTNPYGPVKMIGTSYCVKFDPIQGAGGTIPFCQVEVQVSNDFGFQLEDILFDVPMGLTAGDTEYEFRGPLWGNNVTFTVINSDTVPMTFSISEDSNNIVQLTHTMVTQAFGNIGNGYHLAPAISPRKLLYSLDSGTGLAAGTGKHYLVPVTSGPINLNVATDTPANPLAVQLAPMVATNSYAGTSGGLIVSGRTDVNGNFNWTVYGGRTCMMLSIENVGGAATDWFIGMQGGYT